MREHLKPQNLSFTEIAKRVGEQWQSLDPHVKGQYESRAASSKEKYRTDIARYKTTDNYREYSEYLHAFNLKNADDKRTKIEKAPSVTSSQSGPEQDEPLLSQIPSRHRKADSFGSSTTYSIAHDHPSPTAASRTSPTLSSFAGPPYFKSPSPSSAAMASPWVQRASRNFNPVFATAERPPTTPVDSQMRNPSTERSEYRSTSSHLTNLLQDSDMLHARSSPLGTFRHESSRSSHSSPVSSDFSNSVTQLPTYQSSLTSMISNVVSPPASNLLHRLPPLSTIVGASSEPRHPPKAQLQGYRTIRPDFSVSLLPVTATTPASAEPAGNHPSRLRPENRQPSFKGEYDAKPIFGEDSRIWGGNIEDPRLSSASGIGREESSIKSRHGPETQTSRIKSESDSGSQGASSKSGNESEVALSPLRHDADPLSVLACAGRMVDREERRGRTRRNEKRDQLYHQSH